jgi:hypothetical protein
MTLMSPPEGTRTKDLVSLEFGSDSPTLIVSQGVAIFLEECIDTRNTAIPTVFKIFKG